MPLKCGPVVQLVRTLACHARGRRFEPVPGRHIFATMAQVVEHILGKDEVGGSSPPSSSRKKHLHNASAFFNEINPYGFVKYADAMKYAEAYELFILFHNNCNKTKRAVLQ